MRTITWNTGSQCLTYIDQTRLPAEQVSVETRSVTRLADGIQRLEVRGAPALGVAGGYGVALSCLSHQEEMAPAFRESVIRDAAHLRATRPTAINLTWGIDRVLQTALQENTPAAAYAAALREAQAIEEEDVALCHRIGEFGAKLLPDTCTVLTHCNAGALACVEWGTALGVVRSAVKVGKNVSVLSCETRPLNQGSRLTAFELQADDIPVKTIPDSAAAHLMRKGMIDAVVVGADRITPDAVFNKIGTYMHAVCADRHNIPFYVAAPYSTLDLSQKESDITIEERSREELAVCGGKQLMPDGVPVVNPAFDTTPLSLVTAIITDKGILRYPYTELAEHDERVET
ncbi:S-methyl-5-thioribose-1-phosphate isomerase [Methanogenium organophilum]|uniref:Putative methylthioribose-1-phosphate isomerase n=1 Tax=Methanogenium organophilum TaxID=2199 RepID=A0A9X9S459_METOG|nr:S-methyl-5-thioribose-1-phosphate isomerase [Methanogenium organophilum]WAI01649.1 S-methyl-5-thioribose-1-phosphate isomerase [Methanogenium organophilum]